MKKLKKLISLLLLVTFGSCMTVSAETSKSDALIQWKADENQKGAALTVAPTAEMKENAVTTMQITAQVTDVSQKISDVTVTFDEAVTTSYRIAEYNYKADKNELNIFLSDPKALFGDDTKSCVIGTVNISTDAKEYQVSISPTAVKTVTQSHVTESVKAEELQKMTVSLKKEAAGTENPDIPGNPENPDTPAVFDKASDVVKELNEGKASEVTLNIGKDGKVSGEDQKAVFQALKGKDKAVIFAVKDGGKLLYSFTFRGDQIINENITVNFKTEIGASNRTIEGLMERDAQSIILEFAHIGQLPGKTEIKAYVGGKFADGEKLYFYYYNPDTKAVEPVQKNIVVVEGYATFELSHCSSYVLTTKEVKNAGKFPVPGGDPSSGITGGGTNGNILGGSGSANTVQKTSVKTGDTSPIALYIAVVVIAILAIVIVIWKRMRK